MVREAGYRARLRRPIQTPAQVADQAIAAIKANALYVFTHPEFQPVLAARFQAMSASTTAAADPAALENVLAMEELPLATYRDAAGTPSSGSPAPL